MKRVLTLVVAGLLAFSFAGNPAEATPKIKKQFDEKYAPKDGTPEQQKFAETIKEGKCWVCHNQDPNDPMSRKIRNAYGRVLDELLPTKEDAKDDVKIKAAIEKAEDMPSKEGGPTFGDLIKKGELPVQPNSEKPEAK